MPRNVGKHIEREKKTTEYAYKSTRNNQRTEKLDRKCSSTKFFWRKSLHYCTSEMFALMGSRTHSATYILYTFLDETGARELICRTIEHSYGPLIPVYQRNSTDSDSRFVSDSHHSMFTMKIRRLHSSHCADDNASVWTCYNGFRDRFLVQRSPQNRMFVYVGELDVGISGVVGPPID